MSLDRVLSAAVQLTRGYTRLEHGRQQQVRPYQARPAAAHLGSGLPRARVAWDKVQAGTVVMFGGTPWRVLRTHVSQTSGMAKAGKPNAKGTRTGTRTGRQGKGVNTKGGGSAGSQGKGVNTKGGTPAAKAGPSTSLLRNMQTGRELEVTLPASYKVVVI